MRAVFISHASQDPDWPDDRVDALASRLQQAGVSVQLDLWHQRKLRRKLGLATWNDWMDHCLKGDPLVLCLGSAEFAERWECDPEKPAGKGVAFESSQVIRRLYEQKQRNDGWLWIALTDRANPDGCVPRRVAGYCDPYFLPSEEAQLVDELANYAVGNIAAPEMPLGGGVASSPPAPDPAPSVPESHGLSQQQQWAADRLAEAPKLLTQLKQPDTWRSHRPPGLAQFDGGALAASIASADTAQSDAAMLATRRALGRLPRLDNDQRLAAERAAVALYCLAAGRRVALSLARLSGRVGLVSVPSDAHLYCAMVATVLAGGRLELQPGQQAGLPVPAWSFDVHGAPTGDGSPHAFDRAVYAALFPNAEHTPDLALDAGPLTQRQLADIRALLKQLREVDDQAVALVVHVGCHRERADAFGQAHALPLFIADPGLAADVLGLDADDFVADLSQFWRTFTELPQHLARERAAATPPVGRPSNPNPASPHDPA